MNTKTIILGIALFLITIVSASAELDLRIIDVSVQPESIIEGQQFKVAVSYDNNGLRHRALTSEQFELVLTFAKQDGTLVTGTTREFKTIATLDNRRSFFRTILTNPRGGRVFLVTLPEDGLYTLTVKATPLNNIADVQLNNNIVTKTIKIKTSEQCLVHQKRGHGFFGRRDRWIWVSCDDVPDDDSDDQDDDSDEQEEPLETESTSRKTSVFVGGVNLPDQVSLGETLAISVKFENSGDNNFDEANVRASIPELGLVSAQAKAEDFKLNRNEARTLLVDIPEDTEPGLYSVRVTIDAGSVHRVIHRDVFVTE